LFNIFKSKKPPEAPVSPVADVQTELPSLPLQPPLPQPAPRQVNLDAPSWFSRLKSGLSKTREVLNTDVTELFSRHGQIDDALYESLETTLITADVGIAATQSLLDDLKQVAKTKKLSDPLLLQDEFNILLVNLLERIAKPLQVESANPFVIMIVGVNGAGKTTTIGKLAKYFQSQGKSVMLAAGDTFRAAAREQLATWGERNNVVVISQTQGDSAAVIFDAVQSAKARKIDVVLADTAGRLPTQLHLMEEIKKVKRVIAKAMPTESGAPTAPHEVLLVLDANTGQNGVAQVNAFDQALGLTGLVVTKLDGTAKGGMLAAIAMRPSLENPASPVPVRFIGVGEGIEDLRPFNATEFVAALFGKAR
jgi:fused signal recognition particle receptor